MGGMSNFLDNLNEHKEGEETIIVVHGEPFVVSRATDDDIERVSKGFICID